MAKILTFYAPKDADFEKVAGESATVQEDYESLPDLISRICRGEVRPSVSTGYTLDADDESDEAFDSCEDVNDVDIIPLVVMDESGFASGFGVEPSQRKTAEKETSVSASEAEECEAPSKQDERSTANAVQADVAG